MKTISALMTLFIFNFASANAAQAPDPAVQNYIDSEMKSLEFPLSQRGDTNASVLTGQAAQLYQAWSDSNGNPQVHSQNLNGSAISVGGRTYWALVAGSTSAELGGQFINYIAIADTSTGDLVAEGATPPYPIQWQSALTIQPLGAPAPYIPNMKPVTSKETSEFFISEWEREFDEVAIKNETYSGTDASGNPLEMSWNANGGSLNVKFIRERQETVASFSLTSSTPIIGSNYDQYDADAEGNYLVVATQASTLWVHSFEGNTTIRIQTGSALSEFDFDIDH